MFAEYDWTSNVYRVRLGHTFIAWRGERSFPTKQALKDALAIAGCKLGKKTDTRSWRIDNEKA